MAFDTANLFLAEADGSELTSFITVMFFYRLSQHGLVLVTNISSSLVRYSITGQTVTTLGVIAVIVVLTL